MADRRSLGIIGYILGGVTGLIMLIGIAVVSNEVAVQAQTVASAPPTAQQ